MGFKKGNKFGNRFKKGESGNPKGAPKGAKRFKTRLKELAEQEIDYKDLSNKKIRTSVGNAVILALAAKGIYKQDVTALKTLIEMIDGKAVNRVEGEIKCDPLTSLLHSVGAIEEKNNGDS